MMPATLGAFLPARIASASQVPWIPADTPGKWSRPLRFLRDNRGFVELLRMDPGVVMPLHRHTGEVHVYNLCGTRQLCTGECAGPGDYVYEPAGHTDWWKVVGDDPMIALVVVMGEVEFLGPGGVICARAGADTRLGEYRRHCNQHGLPEHDLLDA